MNSISLRIPQSSDRYNIGEVLIKLLDARGSEPVLRCAKRDCTGSEVARLARSAQDSLGQLGLAPGDRVLLMLRDTPAFYAAFIGAIRGGFIPVPISTLLPPSDVAFIAKDADVRAVLLDEALPDTLRDDLLYPPEVPLRLTKDWEFAGASASPGEPPAWEAKAHDPCLWLYTSGSTGRPKGVIHRHGSIPAAVELYARAVLGIGPDDVILSAPKLYFGYGLGNSLFFPLLLGARVILHPERPTPEAMFDLIEQERPTVFFGVPTLYARMLAHPGSPHLLESLRLCVSAGEALVPGLYQKWRERYGLEILDGLGMTETLHIVLSNLPNDVRPGSSGKVVPGYRLRIVDDDDRNVADGEAGTLLVGGPSNAISYHARGADSARVMFQPNWIRTSDSYRRDRDGYYYHLGRTDDLIKVSGQFVSPIEVEGTLTQHPDVLEAAVVADKDEHGLCRPKAFVVLRSRRRPERELEAELRRFIKERLTPHKYPRSIEFVQALPRTGTGKIQRYVLRRRVAAASGAAGR